VSRAPRRAARALLLLGLLWPAWGGAGAAPAAPPRPVAYFDHYAHGAGRPAGETPALCADGVDNDGDGVKDAARACDPARRARLLACGGCHQGAEATRPMGHAQCEGCHDTARILARAGSPGVPYCRSCHISATQLRAPPFRQPAGVGRFVTAAPEGGWSQLRLARFDHELHSRWAGVCEVCHAPVSGRPSTERERRSLARAISEGARPARGPLFSAEFSHGGHEACARCHSPALGPAQPTLSVQMRDCEACHEVAPPSPPLAPAVTQTTGLFQHAAHAAASGTNPCRVCHTNTGVQPGTRAVQLPAKAACATCHGGAVAFDLGPSSCARCHIQQVYQP